MVLAVVLENNVWTYFPGQTINGNVVVTKNIWHKIEGLSIRFLGKMEFGSAASAPTMPPEDTLPNYQQDRSILNRFTRRPVQETVLDNKLNLLHSWKVLKPGSHEFPFSYTLPDEDDLPESIKIDGFRVHYEFVVVMRRPRDDYKVYQTPFYVQTRLMENEMSVTETVSKYSTDFALKTENTIGFCMCCRSGPYGIMFRVPKRIVNVGKDVPFVFELWNETSLEMDSAKICLVREFKHKKGLETKRREVVSELSGPSVPPGDREVWASYFRIPINTPQTNFARREIYEINYYLKGLVHPVNRTNRKISVKCPLLIILSDDHNQITNINTSYAEENANIPIAPPPDCPPTYEEATMGVDNTSDSPLLE